jgi:hypothetical protein
MMGCTGSSGRAGIRWVLVTSAHHKEHRKYYLEIKETTIRTTVLARGPPVIRWEGSVGC